MNTVLIVEDDEQALAELTQLLPQSGEFEVVAAAGAEEAVSLADQRRFDLVLLDVGLPDPAEGFRLCAQLRRMDASCPIIMVTGYRESKDMVCGLESGADDYVRKPFSITELTARIRARLRHRDLSANNKIVLGTAIIDLTSGDVERNGSFGGTGSCSLTVREAGVLRRLYRAAGQTVSRQVLAREVFGYAAQTRTTTVETHIYNLRRKIETEPKQPRHLIYVRDQGYALVDASVHDGSASG